MPRVDEHIRRAMEEGSFDDLPGKGQPLRLDENPLEDPDWRLANHVLRGSGFTLSWIEARQEIHSEVEAARLALARAWSSFKASRENNQSLNRMEAEWKRAQQLFDEEIARLNQRIADYNLQAPSHRFHLRKLDALSEIGKIISLVYVSQESNDV